MTPYHVNVIASTHAFFVRLIFVVAIDHETMKIPDLRMMYGPSLLIETTYYDIKLLERRTPLLLV